MDLMCAPSVVIRLVAELSVSALPVISVEPYPVCRCILVSRHGVLHIPYTAACISAAPEELCSPDLIILESHLIVLCLPVTGLKIDMEKELGHPLFIRTTRKVELTDFGADLLVYARQICQTWNECRAYLYSENNTNTITIGLSSIILEERDIKDKFTKFMLENPDYGIDIISDDDEDRLIERMRRHDLDVIIIREPDQIRDNCKRLKLYPAEPLCLLIPADHPLSNEKFADIEEFKNETFLLPPATSYSYKLFMALCEEKGFEPKARNSIRGRDVAGKMSRSGIGIPVMSRLAATLAADESVRIVEISPAILQQINLVYPSARRIPAPLEALLEFFRKNMHTISIFLEKQH